MLDSVKHFPKNFYRSDRPGGDQPGMKDMKNFYVTRDPFPTKVEPRIHKNNKNKKRKSKERKFFKFSELFIPRVTNFGCSQSSSNSIEYLDDVGKFPASCNLFRFKHSRKWVFNCKEKSYTFVIPYVTDSGHISEAPLGTWNTEPSFLASLVSTVFVRLQRKFKNKKVLNESNVI
jgi:hypothetical protein